MANELNLSIEAFFSKAGVEVGFSVPLVEITVTGSRASRLSQVIGTGEEALDFAEIPVGGFVVGVNRGATTVTLKIATGETAGIDVKAGEPFAFRFNAAAVPTAIAASGTCLLDMLVVED